MKVNETRIKRLDSFVLAGGHFTEMLQLWEAFEGLSQLSDDLPGR